MPMLRLSTQLHKWIALVVGVQVLFWVAGGLVMTAIPIETVRSEHHVREAAPAALPAVLLRALPDAAGTMAGGVARAELKSTPRGPAWVLTPVRGEPVALAADTGRPFPALTPAEAARLAAQAYTGEGRPVSAVHLSEAPAETGRTGPIWRVEFSDREQTAFYLSPETGEVVTRRSAVWRFYDFFWRLHVMDWKHGEDFNHPLIIVTTILTLSIVVTGFILLWIRLSRDIRLAHAARRKP
ncbi:PepSY domain-containing protein [Brevundimonas viscosa]|uniref:PepSY-associated TM region n=1 Tax=Brevundimonas viscosa TaxID=871741 RepID=A0A1I6PTZ8_9CAUL|nr:PepSY domain-containing protein [Brevundimonas viscosa]SFS43666.1 PepSY-associated TM region [Brevundimonas viscosa]